MCFKCPPSKLDVLPSPALLHVFCVYHIYVSTSVKNEALSYTIDLITVIEAFANYTSLLYFN